jgi:hypothetical protein
MTTNVHAQSMHAPLSLSQILNKCDAALNAKIEEAALCTNTNDLRERELTRLYNENEIMREKGTHIYDNPYVLGALGLVAGVFITSRINK